MRFGKRRMRSWDWKPANTPEIWTTQMLNNRQTIDGVFARGIGAAGMGIRNKGYAVYTAYPLLHQENHATIELVK